MKSEREKNENKGSAMVKKLDRDRKSGTFIEKKCIPNLRSAIENLRSAIERKSLIEK